MRSNCPMIEAGAISCDRCWTDPDGPEALDECYERAADFASMLAQEPISWDDFEEVEPLDSGLGGR